MSTQDNAWMQRLKTVGSLPDLKEEISQGAVRLGFQHYVYRARFPDARSGFNEICLDNCPSGWRKYYLKRGMGPESEALRNLALQQVTPILWRELLPEHPILMKKAKECGLGTGVIHPVHGSSGQWGALSLIKTDDGVESERSILEGIAETQLFAVYVHESSARLVRRRRATPVPPPAAELDLSEREKQCLALAARGKTAYEIGRILTISERTVTFHLGNVRRKLGTVSSPHAIVRAVSLGLIAGS